MKEHINGYTSTIVHWHGWSRENLLARIEKSEMARWNPNGTKMWGPGKLRGIAQRRRTKPKKPLTERPILKPKVAAHRDRTVRHRMTLDGTVDGWQTSKDSRQITAVYGVGGIVQKSYNIRSSNLPLEFVKFLGKRVLRYVLEQRQYLWLTAICLVFVVTGFLGFAFSLEDFNKS